MRIALIGSRDIQQFPTISYGGIETCVENLAWGLHQCGQEFVCVVPKRKVRQPFPFEIVESDVPPMGGPEYNVWPYAHSLPAIVKQLEPDIIWSQSFWSAQTLQHLDIPIICTFHDYAPEPAIKQRWLSYRKNTWYRFISRFQYHQWLDPTAQWQQDRTFHQYTGLADDAYAFGPDHARQAYFLWVAGLNWGMETKGLHIFIELAKRCPDKQFIAYGKGYGNILEELNRLNDALDNFQFRGELKRGEPHQKAFAQARAFIMPTQMPEPFGRTVIESMSKGTPVLGSTHGALPELIKNGVSGFTTDSVDELQGHLEFEFDHRQCFEYAKRFHVNAEIDALIEKSEQILATCKTKQSPPAPSPGNSPKAPLAPGAPITLSERDPAQVYKNFSKRIAAEVYPQGELNTQEMLIDKMLPEFVQYLPDTNINILDVNCGHGHACHKFRELGFQHITAISPCHEDVAATKARRFDSHTMDITALQFADHQFDALWARHALVHSPNPYLTLLEFNRVMKPNAVIYLEMPKPDSPRTLEAWPYVYSVLGENMWQALFKKSGFQVVYSGALSKVVPAEGSDGGGDFEEVSLVYVVKKIREERP